MPASMRLPTRPSYLLWYDISITNSCCLSLCYVPTKITYDISTVEIRREQLECTGSLTLWTIAMFFNYILAKFTSNLLLCTPLSDSNINDALINEHNLN